MELKIAGFVLAVIGILIMFITPVPIFGMQIFKGGLVLLVVDRACNAWGRK